MLNSDPWLCGPHSIGAPCCIAIGEMRPDDTAIDHALERVTASPEFAGSARLRDLLTYLVDRAKRSGAPPKGYDIAIDVFGRSADFDPANDAIVRVQAGRLRKALSHYYLTDGDTDPVKFDLPKGSYRLGIGFSEATSSFGQPGSAVEEAGAAFVASSTTAKSAPERLRGLAILPFSVTQSVRDVARVDEGARIICAILSKAPAIGRVILAPDGFERTGMRDIADRLGVRYLLSGSVTEVDTEVHLNLHLIDGLSGASVWAELYRAPSNEVAVRWSELVGNIAGVVRARVYEAKRAEIEARGSTGDLDPDELCILATWMPTEWATSLDQERQRIRFAERALELDRNNGTAHSILADKIAYLATLDPPSDTAAALRRAGTHANRALALSARNPDALLNVILYYWHTGATSKLDLLAERARHLDAHHPILAIWSKIAPHVGTPGTDELISGLMNLNASLAETNPSRWMTQNWISSFLINRGDYSGAKEYGRKAYSIFLTPETGLRVAACLVQLGDADGAADIASEIRTRWPHLDLDHFANVTVPRQCGGRGVAKDLTKVYQELAEACRPYSLARADHAPDSIGRG